MAPHAVIDVGTNTVILLIASQSKKDLKILHDEAIITRLGQAVSEKHFFLPEAMKRTLTALQSFKETCKKHKVDKISVIGTAAFRAAANAEVFRTMVKKECGFKIDIITGDQEAQYTFEAATADFGKKHNKLMVIDIGGGSTEIIMGETNAPKGKKKNGPQSVISLVLGSVVMTEQYVTNDPIPDEDLTRLVLAIRNMLRDNLEDFYPENFNAEEYTMVATAGTATTLAAIDQKMAIYNPQKIHGSLLSKKGLEALIETLASMTVKQRQTLPGCEPLRADVILAGAIILNELMKFFKKSETLISDRGLRYGVWQNRFGK